MKWVFRLLLVTCLAVITWLALTSETMPTAFQIWDKLNHLAVFITLAFLADFSFPQSQKNWIKGVFLATYGLGLEIIQLLQGHRYFEVQDLLAEIIGVICYLPLRGHLQRIPFLSPERPGDD